MRRFPDGSIFAGSYLYSSGSLYSQRESRWEAEADEERMANGGGVGAFAPLVGAARYSAEEFLLLEEGCRLAKVFGSFKGSRQCRGGDRTGCCPQAPSRIHVRSL